MKIMRSILYSLIIGLVAGFFVPRISGNQTIHDRKSKSKIVNSKYFKAAVAVLMVGIGGIGCVYYFIRKNRKKDTSTTPHKSSVSIKNIEDITMEEKIKQCIPDGIDSIVADILSVTRIAYNENGYIGYNEKKQQIKDAIQATVEKREKDWYLVLTYNEPGEDNAGRLYKSGYFSGADVWTAGKAYHIEYRIPKKYAS